MLLPGSSSTVVILLFSSGKVFTGAGHFDGLTEARLRHTTCASLLRAISTAGSRIRGRGRRATTRRFRTAGRCAGRRVTRSSGSLR